MPTATSATVYGRLMRLATMVTRAAAPSNTTKSRIISRVASPGSTGTAGLNP